MEKVTEAYGFEPEQQQELSHDELDSSAGGAFYASPGRPDRLDIPLGEGALRSGQDLRVRTCAPSAPPLARGTGTAGPVALGLV